jgi:hypothetical protein
VADKLRRSELTISEKILIVQLRTTTAKQQITLYLFCSVLRETFSPLTLSGLVKMTEACN